MTELGEVSDWSWPKAYWPKGLETQSFDSTQWVEQRMQLLKRS